MGGGLAEAGAAPPMRSPVDLQRVHTVLALNAVPAGVGRLADQTPVFVPEQGDETLTPMQRRTELCLVPHCLCLQAVMTRPVQASLPVPHAVSRGGEAGGLLEPTVPDM